jgi:lipopolysaccharide cholinephosphotransferase
MNYKKIKKLSDMPHEEWIKIRHSFCKKNLKEKINKEEYKKDILDIKFVLDNIGINFWIIFGTLLGAIREKDFLEWDDNINIAVYENDLLENIDVIKNNFISKGFIFRVVPKKHGTKINIHRHNHKSSIEGLYIEDLDKDKKYLCSNKFKHPRKYFETYGEVEFKGEIFRVPSPVEEYLSFLYKDWKVPIKLSDLSHPEKWRNKKNYKKKGI